MINDSQGRANASQVDYKGLAQERAALASYLQSLSAVTPAQYTGWSKSQQYAFLANAYNAFTIEKVLTRYPNLKSIRDFGTVIGNPWKDRFFTLLGKPQHLDGIEHETMRAPGVFDDPRVHVAVNCASVGCPMLGNRALTPDRIDTQLDELFARFMSDRSRNRYNVQTRRSSYRAFSIGTARTSTRVTKAFLRSTMSSPSMQISLPMRRTIVHNFAPARWRSDSWSTTGR